MDRAAESTRPSADHGGTGPTGPGDAAARYEQVRELGRGAMGTVWLARDRSFDREVAVERCCACSATTAGPGSPTSASPP